MPYYPPVISTPISVANGGTGASTASITSFNNITGYSASGATGTTSTNIVFSTSPLLTTPNLLGGSGVPATPSAGQSILFGAGTGAVRPHWLSSTGTDESIITTADPSYSAWQSWIPTITATSGSFTTVSGSGTYVQLGKTVIFQVSITITTNGTASGVNYSLPVTATSGTFEVGTGREDAVNGKSLASRIVTTTTASVVYYDNTIPNANGLVLRLFGTYQAA